MFRYKCDTVGTNMGRNKVPNPLIDYVDKAVAVTMSSL